MWIYFLLFFLFLDRFVPLGITGSLLETNPAWGPIWRSRVPEGVLAYPPPTNRTPPKFWGLNREPELAVAIVAPLLIGIEMSFSQRVACIVAHTDAQSTMTSRPGR